MCLWWTLMMIERAIHIYTCLYRPRCLWRLNSSAHAKFTLVCISSSSSLFFFLILTLKVAINNSPHGAISTTCLLGKKIYKIHTLMGIHSFHRDHSIELKYTWSSYFCTSEFKCTLDTVTRCRAHIIYSIIYKRDQGQQDTAHVILLEIYRSR